MDGQIMLWLDVKNLFMINGVQVKALYWLRLGLSNLLPEQE